MFKHNSRTVLVSLFVAAGMAFLVSTSDAQAREGARAPAFSATGSDGRTHTLESLTRNRTLVLYFIKEDCPVNNQAIAHYVRLANAYGRSVNFIGVFDGDSASWQRYARRHNVQFTALLDPQMRIIRSFGAQRSPWVVIVRPDRTVGTIQRGFSTGLLTRLGSLLARAGGTQEVRLRFPGAPSSERFG